MNKLPILIVEDEPDGADMVKRLLDAVGLKSTHAPSAEFALDALEANPQGFQAAIVDLALPEMDGIELMQVIRRTPQFAHLPLIAVTAFHTPELKFKALDAGFNAYFAKPLDTNFFAQALERLLS
jgi:CheY-like chemotaxis protein